MAIEGSKAFTCFTALKLHFRTDFDYIKYNGKTRPVSDTKLQARKEYDHFRRIERRYGDNLQDFIVSNLVENQDAWIRDLVHPKADIVYNTWKTRQKDIVENTIKEISALPNDMMFCKNGHPELFRKYLAKKISPETMIALNRIFNYIESWDKYIDDPVVWPMHRKFLLKYDPFIVLPDDAVEKITAASVEKLNKRYI